MCCFLSLGEYVLKKGGNEPPSLENVAWLSENLINDLGFRAVRCNLALPPRLLILKVTIDAQKSHRIGDLSASVSISL